MANRNWMNGGKLFAMEKEIVNLNVTVQIGASGAVSSFAGPCIKSVVRISAGKYQINFDADQRGVTNFSKLLAADGSMQSASGGLSGISSVEIQNNPNASVSDAAAPSLTVQCLNLSGAAADPASGSALNVSMLLSNSSIQLGGE